MFHPPTDQSVHAATLLSSGEHPLNQARLVCMMGNNEGSAVAVRFLWCATDTKVAKHQYNHAVASLAALVIKSCMGTVCKHYTAEHMIVWECSAAGGDVFVCMFPPDT